MTAIAFAPCLELPPNPSGGLLYKRDSAIARVFLACARPNGTTIGELRKLVAATDKSGVMLFPLTKHADARGRNGVRWDLRVNGAPSGKLTDTAILQSLDPATRVEIGNVRASDVVVNTRFHRSAPASIADFIERVNRASTPAPAVAEPEPQPEPAPSEPQPAEPPAPKQTKRGKRK